MHSNYFGIQIASLLIDRRWRWQVTLPSGVTILSNRDYPTPKQALREGAFWLSAETAINAINDCLAELRSDGRLHKREYCNLMDSLFQLTQSC